MFALPNHIETEIADPAVMGLTPVVSVLMSTYNHDAHVAEAIEGVIRQSIDFPIELIIGEDCSTDDTRKVVLDYQRRYPDKIRVLYSDKNIGAFNNMNRIFAKSRGEFIAYCEGDDYWHDTSKLDKQVRFLKEKVDYGLVHTEYDYLVHTYGAWRRIRNWNRRYYKKIPDGDVYLDTLKNFFVRTCTVMGRRELLEQHFNSPLRSIENPVGDMPLVWHMSKLAKVGYIGQSLATYRRFQGSMTNSGYVARLNRVKGNTVMLLRIVNYLGIQERDLSTVHRIFKREEFFAAFNAGDVVEFESTSKWIMENDAEFGWTLAFRFRKVAIKFPLLHRMAFRIWQQVREFRFYVLSVRAS